MGSGQEGVLSKLSMKEVFYASCMTRESLTDSSPWLAVAGYSRAVRVGPLLSVSGTTDHGPDGVSTAPFDTYAQARSCLERCLAAAIELGASPQTVLRTRMYLVPEADVRQAARAHREIMGEIAPANTTLFVAGLVGEGLMVEVELDAVVCE